MGFSVKLYSACLKSCARSELFLKPLKTLVYMIVQKEVKRAPMRAAKITFQTNMVEKQIMSLYTCQPFYIYRREIFYLKSAKIFRRGPIICQDVRRRSEDFRRCYKEFCLTQTQEHKGTLTSLLQKENSEKIDHPHRLFLSLFGSGLFK